MAHKSTPATRLSVGCPICNLHLHSVTARIDEISAAGIREVVVFHSTASELRKYQNDMPFPVIGDPDKTLYRRFGVEASAKAVLNPRALAGPSSRLAPRHCRCRRTPARPAAPGSHQR
jgi:peroxiredoxin